MRQPLFRILLGHPLLGGAAVAAAIALADQGTKSFARATLPLCDERRGVCGSSADFFGLVRVENAGSVGGVAQGLDLWMALAFVAVVAFVLYLRSGPSRATAPAAGLALGGALGNFFDRLGVGAVTDFISAGGGVIIFNVADVALACGGVALSVALYRQQLARPGNRAAVPWPRRLS